ncbi:MAG: hypothetical protein J6A74_03585, partial [Oscillospiraceae bacterium]|nr:hypothetical protein [Oscillospiraceae bacterium]
MGILLWESSAGRWLRPFFAGFWRYFFHITGILMLPIKIFLKKIQKIANSLLLSGKKIVTIKCKFPTKPQGGADDGKASQSTQPDPAGIPTQSRPAQR